MNRQGKKSSVSLSLILGISAIVLLLFHPGFREIYTVNRLVSYLYVVTLITFILAYYKDKIIFRVVFVLLFLLMVIIQIKSTNIRNTYSLTPYEKDLQIQRMNQFPPKLARLAYIMEGKKEMQIINKVQDNFFSVLDFNRYFPDQFTLLSIPFFLIGLFLLVKDGKRLFLYPLLGAIILTTLIGVNGKYGPFLIYPFITYSIFVSITYIFNKYLSK